MFMVSTVPHPSQRLGPTSGRFVDGRADEEVDTKSRPGGCSWRVQDGRPVALNEWAELLQESVVAQ